MLGATDLEHLKAMWTENHVDCCTQLARLRSSASAADAASDSASAALDGAALVMVDALNELALRHERSESLVQKMYDKLATARRKLADALSDATATDEVLVSVAASEVALYEQELQLEARLLRALAVSAQPADVIAACIVWREQPQLSEDEIDVLYARRAAIAVR
jgi:hypothetical protein